MHLPGNRLSICYISNAYVPSLQALSVVVMKTCQALAQEGHQVELLAPRPRSPAVSLDDQLWSHYGVSHTFPVKTLRASHRISLLDYDLSIASRLWRHRPDLIYSLHLRFAALSSVLGWPVIFEPHDIPAGRLGDWYIKQLLRGGGLKGIVAISEGMKSKLLERYPRELSETRFVVAGDGVDMERFEQVPTPQEARARIGLDVDRFTAGYTGHLYPGRGIELIVELARRLPQIQFVMVGGHSDSVLERRSEAAKLGLDNLRYEGFVPNDILPMYQAACEALLMPYQRRVSFTGGKGDTSGVMSPMKMFEYMAMGRLIITSNLPVIREVLNEDNAAVCEPDDIVAWYQSLRRGMTDPTWATRLAQQARLDARKYTWRRKVRAIFAALLGTGGRGTDS